MATIAYVRSRRRWRVRWRATNRRAVHHRLFAGSRYFLEKATAVAFFAEIEAQERLWRGGDVTLIETVDHAIDQYFRHARRFTDRTQGLYRDVLDRFRASLPADVLRIQQIAAAHVQEFCYRLHDRGLANRTINSQLTAVKSFCRFLQRRYNVPNAAAEVAMYCEDPPVVRFLAPVEYRRALEAAGPLAHDRILFLANTGLRASEFSGAVATLRPDLVALTIVGKGRKQRTVPLNRICREVLARPPIYRPTSRNALGLQFNRLARRCGLPIFGPHALRHYFATQLLLAGVPIIKVSKLLGHASVQTTQRAYAHILDKDLATVTDVLV